MKITLKSPCLVALRLVNDVLETGKALGSEFIQSVPEQVPGQLHVPRDHNIRRQSRLPKPTSTRNDSLRAFLQVLLP